jgi:hypothetical protein
MHCVRSDHQRQRGRARNGWAATELGRGASTACFLDLPRCSGERTECVVQGTKSLSHIIAARKDDSLTVWVRDSRGFVVAHWWVGCCSAQVSIGASRARMRPSSRVTNSIVQGSAVWAKDDTLNVAVVRKGQQSFSVVFLKLLASRSPFVL